MRPGSTNVHEIGAHHCWLIVLQRPNGKPGDHPITDVVVHGEEVSHCVLTARPDSACGPGMLREPPYAGPARIGEGAGRRRASSAPAWPQCAAEAQEDLRIARGDRPSALRWPMRAAAAHRRSRHPATGARRSPTGPTQRDPPARPSYRARSAVRSSARRCAPPSGSRRARSRSAAGSADAGGAE